MADAGVAFKELVRTVKSSSATQSGELRSYAEQNNSTLQRSFKDLYRALQSNNRQSSGLGNAISENAAETQQVSRKLEGTNSTLQQTLSIQSSTLVEVRALNSSMKNLYDLIRSQGSSSLLGNAAGAAAGAALSTAGRAVAPVVATAGRAVAPVVAPILGGGILGAGLGALTQKLFGGNNEVPQNTVAPGQQASPLSNEEPKVQKILAAIRGGESGGRYNAGNDAGKSSASGAYQFIDSTWKAQASKVSGASQYQRAKDAPPAVQDAVAANYVKDILRRTNGDVEAVFREWFTGKPYAKSLTDAQQRANPGLTIDKVIADRMRRYDGSQPSGGQQQRQQRQQTETPAPPQRQRDTGSSPSPQPSAENGQQSRRAQTASLGGNPLREQSRTAEGGGNVFEDQTKEAQVRKLPISQQLKSVLQRAASEAGVDVRVKSGGQPEAGSGGKRVGSTRHDNGNAADLDLYVGNRKLSPNNAEDLATYKKFVATAKAAGATGIGAGEGYMAPDASRIHVGFGSEAVWGAGGKGANAADWLKDAVGEGSRMAAGNRKAELQPSGQPSKAQALNRSAEAAANQEQPPQQPMIFNGDQSAPYQMAQGGNYNPLVDQVALNSGFSPPWIWMLRNAFPSIGGRIMV